MGFFSFIEDIVETVITDPIEAAVKGVSNLVGSGDDPFDKPLEFLAKPITAPLEALTGAAASTGLVGATPGNVSLVVPGPGAGQGARNVPFVQRSQPPITGGQAAFGKFTTSSLGGGNPAWHSLGRSAISSRVSLVPSARSRGQWQQRGTSVRLLA